MTPDFALILSHDNVRLLHRAADGWHIVGEADPTADNLDERLAMLRRTATSLATGGLFCKLVLPDSLIRYLEETPDDAVSDPAERARHMLDGATPYAVDDLVFDVITTRTGQIHVAAVARETLEEAESFAVAHRFNPVLFTGWCADQSFPTEPDFGPTSVAAGLLGGAVSAETDATPVFISATNTESGKVGPETAVDEKSVYERTGFDATEYPASDEDLTDGTEEFRDSEVTGTGPRTETVPDLDPPVTFTPRPRDFTAPATEDAPEKPPAATANSLRAPAGPRVDLAGMHARADGDRSGLVSGFIAAVVVVALGSAALWATGMIGQGGISSWLDRPSEIPPDAQFASPPQPTEPAEAEGLSDLPGSGDATGRSATDAAIQEALSVPVSPDPQPQTPEPPADLRADYAVTGIWPVAPDVPRPPGLVGLEDLYTTSIDPVQAAFDAVALPAVQQTPSDLTFAEPASPAPAGTAFTLNERGFVVPGPEGAMNPDGILVYAGPPPVKPPEFRPQAVDPGQDPVLMALLAGYRPKLRPAGLIESNERATLSGLTRAELAEFRPKSRPPSVQENAIAAAASLVPRESTDNVLPADQEAADAAPEGNVIAVSLRPASRPSDFGLTVARAQQQAASAPPAPATVTTASVAPRAVAPKIPSSASASREATQKNAINLRRVNLIGVYGKPSDRRALIRLGNGRYQKVKVGDRLDGGRVSAIGDSELRYQKSGRNIILKMPRG